jgi:hypothetical protein
MVHDLVDDHTPTGGPESESKQYDGRIEESSEVVHFWGKERVFLRGDSHLLLECAPCGNRDCANNSSTNKKLHIILLANLGNLGQLNCCSSKASTGSTIASLDQFSTKE